MEGSIIVTPDLILVIECFTFLVLDGTSKFCYLFDIFALGDPILIFFESSGSFMLKSDEDVSLLFSYTLSLDFNVLL